MTRSQRIVLTGAAVVVGLIAASNYVQGAAQQETTTFTVALSPANEVPPVTNAESKGSADTTITLKVTRDAAKAITAATADFTVTLKGFPAGTGLTAAHIHRGATGVNGGPVVNLGLKAGEVALADGAGSFSKAAVTVTPAVAQELIDGPSGFYFNVHTAMNGGGVARGQLVKK